MDHDQRFKALLRVFFAEFLRLFFAPWAERMDLSNVEWLDKEVFPDPPEGKRRALDMVAQVDTLTADYQGRLLPPLGGYVYRFTLYLPMLSEGQKVFSSQQHALLGRLFHKCFGGYSESSAEGHPPWFGSWSAPGAACPIIDRHILIVLYSPQVEEAKDLFRRLRWILERPEVANQEVVLIEHITAWLVEAAAL